MSNMIAADTSREYREAIRRQDAHSAARESARRFEDERDALLARMDEIRRRQNALIEAFEQEAIDYAAHVERLHAVQEHIDAREAQR